MQLTFVNCGKKSGKNLTFTAAEYGSCTQLEREVRGKFLSAISRRCNKINPKKVVRVC